MGRARDRASADLNGQEFILDADADTSITADTDDTIDIKVGGSDKIRIDSSGRLLMGATTAESFAPSTTPQVQIEGTDHHTSSAAIIRNSNDNGQALLILGKSRGTSVGSDTVVQDDDGVGEVLFTAADGSDRTPQVASVRASVDGTPGSNDMPGRLEFYTTADGSQTITERMRIDSSGKVGIATTNPLSALHIKDNDGIMLEDDGTTNTSKIQTLNAGGLRFYTGDTSSQTSRMTIETDGDVSITDGNLVLDSGHGIDFSDTSNSSVTGTGNQAELLADYEKGTWTPNDASGANITYAQKQGSYVKIGDQVTAWGYINAPSSVTHTGAIQINGLPFTTAAAGDAASGTSARGGGMIAFQDTGDQDVYVITIRDSQQIEFFNENGQNHSNNLLNGSKTIMFAVTYHTGIA
jgi:hypothetical protein